MSMSKWSDDFRPPAEHRYISPVWWADAHYHYDHLIWHILCRYSMFQVVSSYTNTGMSLVDQSMLPFQTAYPMIVVMIFLILAGNTAFVSVFTTVKSCRSHPKIAYLVGSDFLLHFPYTPMISDVILCVKSPFRYVRRFCFRWIPYCWHRFFSHRRWVISNIVPVESRHYETLRFLLDHPRRCFVYLFPSHQTWFLLTVLLFLK